MNTSAAVVAVIDDDAAQLQLLVAILARQRPAWQLRAIEADAAWVQAVQDDAETALAGAALAVIDYRLDPHTAMDVLPAISRCCPAVVMTGSVEGLDQDACRTAGAATIVAKPYTLDQVQELLVAGDGLLTGTESDASH